MSQNPSPSSSAAPPGKASTPDTKLVVLALVVALGAVILVNLYIYGVKQSVQEGEFSFFRLRIDKDSGEVLRREDVEKVSVPERFRDAFRGVVEPSPVNPAEPERLGDVFTRDTYQGAPLVTAMFDDLTGDPARGLIKPGFRGMALTVDSKTLPKPLKAEMRVDLMAPVRGAGGRREVMPVMESIRVVSVGASTIVDENRRGNARADSNFEIITVEVTPEEAVVLSEVSQLVQQFGVFSVFLRSPGDNRPAYIPEGGINPELLQRLGL